MCSYGRGFNNMCKVMGGDLISQGATKIVKPSAAMYAKNRYAYRN